MFKLRGFRVTLDFITRKQHDRDSDLSSVSMNGAYRTKIHDYNDNGATYTPPRSIDPSMVQLPNSQAKQLKPSKSTGDLAKATTSTQNITRSSHELSSNANNISKLQIKQQKKIEKQRQLEQKKQEKIAGQERRRQAKLAVQEEQKQEKLAAQERRKQEKLSKERGKQDESTQDNVVTVNKLRTKKKNAPRPPQLNQELVSQPPSQAAPKITNTDKNNEKPNKPSKEAKISQAHQTTYSTDTLESSISRSSGPPPYGEFPNISVEPSNNITFGNPVSDSSWDLISQHREQMNKNKTAPTAPKRKKDLQYNVGHLRLDGNSDA